MNMYEGFKSLSPKQLAKNILAKVQQTASQNENQSSQEAKILDLGSEEGIPSSHTEETSLPDTSQQIEENVLNQQPKEMTHDDIFKTKATSLDDLRQQLVEKFRQPDIDQQIERAIQHDNLSPKLVDSYMKDIDGGQTIQDVYNQTIAHHEEWTQQEDELYDSGFYSDMYIDQVQDKYWDYFSEKYGHEKAYDLIPEYNSPIWKELVSISPKNTISNQKK